MAGLYPNMSPEERARLMALGEASAPGAAGAIDQAVSQHQAINAARATGQGEGMFSREGQLRMEAERDRGRQLDRQIAAKESSNEYLQDALAGKTSERDKPAPGTRYTPRYWYGDDAVAKSERDAAGAETVRKIKNAEAADKKKRDEEYEAGIQRGIAKTSGEFERNEQIDSQVTPHGPRVNIPEVVWTNPETGEKEVTEASKRYDPRTFKPVSYTDNQGRPRIKMVRIAKAGQGAAGRVVLEAEEDVPTKKAKKKDEPRFKEVGEAATTPPDTIPTTRTNRELMEDAKKGTEPGSKEEAMAIHSVAPGPGGRPFELPEGTPGLLVGSDPTGPDPLTTDMTLEEEIMMGMDPQIGSPAERRRWEVDPNRIFRGEPGYRGSEWADKDFQEWKRRAEGREGDWERDWERGSKGYGKSERGKRQADKDWDDRQRVLAMRAEKRRAEEAVYLKRMGDPGHSDPKDPAGPGTIGTSAEGMQGLVDAVADVAPEDASFAEKVKGLMQGEPSGPGKMTSDFSDMYRPPGVADPIPEAKRRLLAGPQEEEQEQEDSYVASDEYINKVRSQKGLPFAEGEEREQYRAELQKNLDLDKRMGKRAGWYDNPRRAPFQNPERDREVQEFMESEGEPGAGVTPGEGRLRQVQQFGGSPIMGQRAMQFDEEGNPVVDERVAEGRDSEELIRAMGKQSPIADLIRQIIDSERRGGGPQTADWRPGRDFDPLTGKMIGGGAQTADWQAGRDFDPLTGRATGPGFEELSSGEEAAAGDTPSAVALQPTGIAGALAGLPGRLEDLVGEGMESLGPAAEDIASRFPGALSDENREQMLAGLRAGDEFDPDSPDPSRQPGYMEPDPNLDMEAQLEEEEWRGQDRRLTERMQERPALDPEAGYDPAEMAILQRSDVHGDMDAPFTVPTDKQLALREKEKQRLIGRKGYADRIRHGRRMAREQARNAPRFWFKRTGDPKIDAAMGAAMATQFGNVLGEQVKGRTAREDLLAKGGMFKAQQEQQRSQYEVAMKYKMVDALAKQIADPSTRFADKQFLRQRLNSLLNELSRGGGTARAAGGDPFSDDSFDFSRGDDPFDRSRGDFGGSGINAGQAVAELERDNPGMMAQLEGAFEAPDGGSLNEDIGGFGSPGDLMEDISGEFGGTVRRTNSDQLSYLVENLAGLMSSGQITKDNIAMVGPIIGAKLHASLRRELGRSEDRLSRGGVSWSDIQQFMNDLMAGRMPAGYEGLVGSTRTGGLFNRSR